MSGCDFDTLESLALFELTPARAEEVKAHVASCATCAQELGLLRAERAAFADRARASSPLPSLSVAPARSRWSSPAVVQAKATPPTSAPRFSWVLSSFGVAAAAACAGLFLFPPNGTARLESPAEEPIIAVPASENICYDEALSSGSTSPPKLPVTCEMPEHTSAAATPCSDGEAEAATPAGIDTSAPCSAVTEACYSPLPD